MVLSKELYFDNAATTKPSQAAIDAFYSTIGLYGNPSSTHRAGMNAAKILLQMRASLARQCAARPEELIFTASGTEANNLAVLGIAHARARFSKRIISTDSEHPSVEQPLRALESEGYEVIRISTKKGVLDLESLEKCLSEKTSLVAIMHVNNETGAIYPIKKIRQLIDLSGSGAVLFSDNVQGFLKEDSITSLCDAMSASAHKVNAFKGTGLLYISNKLRLLPVLYGGMQEKGLRPGTENLGGIAAFAAAAALPHSKAVISSLNVRLASHLTAMGVQINRSAECYSPYILNVSLLKVKSEIALNALSERGIYISAGSACSSKKKSSSVLTAFGLSGRELDSAVRISLSEENTAEDIDILAEALSDIINKYGSIR